MSVVDFSSAKMCRVCEIKTDQMNLLLNENKAIVKKLRACADISIDANDDLPKYLCGLCLSDLEYSYKFKIRCEYTDRKFRDAIENGLMHAASTDVEQYIDHNEGDCDGTTLHSMKVEAMLTTDLADYNLDYCTNEDGVFEMAENMDAVSFKDDQISSEYLDEYVDEEILEIEPINASNVEMLEQDVLEQDTLDEVEDEEDDALDTVVLDTADADLDYDLESKVNDHSVMHDSGTESTGKCIVIDLSEEKVPTLRRRSTKVFQCDTCDATFVNFSEFHQHNRTHGHQRYQCNICEKWFSKRYHMKNHMTIHTMVKSFGCTLCSNTYTNQGNLDRHIRVFHHKEKRHVCPECGKSFSQTTILRQHMSIHTSERKFTCDICQKKFKTEAYLILHRNRHLPGAKRRRPAKRSTPRTTKPPQKPCICNECGKCFNSTTLYMSHRRTHSGERPYECNICQKRFSFQQSLRNHKLLHTGEKPFKCDICHSSFRQIGHLQGHKLVHSKQKPHTCMDCGKSFALRGNLTVHKRLHTGETPYHCTVCPRKFYDSNGLKRHRQIHDRKLTEQSQSNMKIERAVPFGINVIAETEAPEMTEEGAESNNDVFVSDANQSVIITNNIAQYTIEVPSIKVDSDGTVATVVYTIPGENNE